MSLNYNWRLGGLRSKNVCVANPQRLDATDGSSRYALGRTVKGEGRTPGTWEPVDVWTLRERVGGKVVTVDTHRSRQTAEAWVARGAR